MAPQAYSVAVSPSGETSLPEKSTFDLSDNDQFIPNTHVNVYSFYHLPDAIGRDHIVENLSRGLANVLTCIPILGGALYRDNTRPGKMYEMGRTVVIRDNHKPIHLAVDHADLDSSMPSLDQLAAVRYSMASFPDLPKRLVPPGSNVLGIRQDDGCPVGVFQATFLPGGIAVTAAISHKVVDAKSVDIVTALWAASTKASFEGPPMPSFEPNLNRSYFSGQTTPSGAEFDLLKKHTHGFTVLPKEDKTQGDPSFGSPQVVQMYHISDVSIAKLKQVCKPSSPDEYVAAYDVVTGLAWRAITRARLPLFDSEESSGTSKMCLPVDTRGRFGESVSDDYIGNAFYMTTTSAVPLAELFDDQGLAKAARAVRHAILSVKVTSLPDLLRMRRGMEAQGRHRLKWLFHRENATSTSWMAMRPYTAYDFGWGFPVAFRTPAVPYEGTVALLQPARLPGQAPGGMDVYICLNKPSMDRLAGDDEFNSYMEPNMPVSTAG